MPDGLGRYTVDMEGGIAAVVPDCYGDRVERAVGAEADALRRPELYAVRLSRLLHELARDGHNMVQLDEELSQIMRMLYCARQAAGQII